MTSSNSYGKMFEDMLVSYRSPALTLKDLGPVGMNNWKLRLKPESPQEKLGLRESEAGKSSSTGGTQAAPGQLSPGTQQALGQMAGAMIGKGSGSPALGKAVSESVGGSKSSKGKTSAGLSMLGGLLAGPAGATVGAKLGGLVEMLGGLLDSLDLDVGITTKMSITSQFSVEGEAAPGDPSSVGGYGNPGIGVGGVGIGGQGMVGMGETEDEDEGPGNVSGGGFGVGPK